jgi:hypothetical protein
MLALTPPAPAPAASNTATSLIPLNDGSQLETPATLDTEIGVDIARMAASIPLGRIAAFGGGFSRESLDRFLEQVRD